MTTNKTQRQKKRKTPVPPPRREVITRHSQDKKNKTPRRDAHRDGIDETPIRDGERDEKTQPPPPHPIRETRERRDMRMTPPLPPRPQSPPHDTTSPNLPPPHHAQQPRLHNPTPSDTPDKTNTNKTTAAARKDKTTREPELTKTAQQDNADTRREHGTRTRNETPSPRPPDTKDEKKRHSETPPLPLNAMPPAHTPIHDDTPA